VSRSRTLKEEMYIECLTTAKMNVSLWLPSEQYVPFGSFLGIAVCVCSCAVRLVVADRETGTWHVSCLSIVVDVKVSVMTAS